MSFEWWMDLAGPLGEHQQIFTRDALPSSCAFALAASWSSCLRARQPPSSSPCPASRCVWARRPSARMRCPTPCCCWMCSRSLASGVAAAAAMRQHQMRAAAAPTSVPARRAGSCTARCGLSQAGRGRRLARPLPQAAEARAWGAAASCRLPTACAPGMPRTGAQPLYARVRCRPAPLAL